MNRIPPAFDHHNAEARPMTADDVAVIRALVNLKPVRTSKHKGLITLLHSRTQPLGNRTITRGEADVLRAIVTTYKAILDERIMRMVGVES